ncbi:MAG: hypothetical protein AB1374_07660 [Bacillota bacterium]
MQGSYNDNFEFDFFGFINNRLEAADTDMLGNTNYEKIEETARELKQMIWLQLPENQRELVIILSEFLNNESALWRTHAFMAGFKAAFDIFQIINNPMPIIFPKWGESTEEICSETLAEARALTKQPEQKDREGRGAKIRPIKGGASQQAPPANPLEGR